MKPLRLSGFRSRPVLAAGCFLLLWQLALAIDDGQALKPPMGWNSWNAFEQQIDETLIKQTADLIVSSGLAEAGYVYVNLDGGWCGPGADAPRPEKFPSGIRHLADYVHARGLKFGLYTHWRSIGNETRDAQQWAAWGVDFVKNDAYRTKSYDPYWARLRDAMAATGRPMVYSIHYNDTVRTVQGIRELAHLWRITEDIQDYYNHQSLPPKKQKWAFTTLDIVDRMAEVAHTIRPGCWADCDMLEIGNGNQTADEYRTQFSMWCLLPAPLIMGHDVRKMTPETLSILANKEAIAVNQDAKCLPERPTRKVRDDGDLEVWCRLLSDDSIAVVALNRSEKPATIPVLWSEIGVAGTPHAQVRDLWAHRDLGLTSLRYDVQVPVHGCAFLKVTPVKLLTSGKDDTPAPALTFLDILRERPAACPTGEVHGMQAGDGVSADLFWRDGDLVELVLHGPNKKRCLVCYRGKQAVVEIEDGRKSIPASTFCLEDRRIAEVAGWLPDQPQSLGRPIADRTAWATLAAHPAWQGIVEQATATLGKPLPEITDAAYLAYTQAGTREPFETAYRALYGHLSLLVKAECLEAQGRFLPAIDSTLRSVCALPTWTNPAHDSSLQAFRGHEQNLDLYCTRVGWLLATVHSLLGDRLAPPVRTLLRENVNQRVLTPFRRQIAGELPLSWWATCEMNWNAVCLANITGAAMALADDPRDRAVFAVAAEHYIPSFLNGFGADGYCREGLGYWNYGFGLFLQLSETLHRATGGRLDLLKHPAVGPIAQYGRNVQLRPGVNPSFSDCDPGAKAPAWMLDYLSRRLQLPLGPRGFDPVSAEGDLPFAMAASFPGSATTMPPCLDAGPLPHRSWFEQSGVLISRPGDRPACRLALAVNGGHNAEPHNHNDIGSYIVSLDDTVVLTDPGKEVYSERSFSSRRYESPANNSFGHPVPVVAGQLQRTGRDAQAAFSPAEFTDAHDTLTMDFTSAYAVKSLSKLERTFIYDRSGAGQITVRDSVAFTSPQPFETALVSLGEVEKIGPNHLRLTHEKAVLDVTVETGGEPFEIVVGKVEAEFRNRATRHRIAIRLNNPVRSAAVASVIRPAEAAR